MARTVLCPTCERKTKLYLGNCQLTRLRCPDDDDDVWTVVDKVYLCPSCMKAVTYFGELTESSRKRFLAREKEKPSFERPLQ